MFHFGSRSARRSARRQPETEPEVVGEPIVEEKAAETPHVSTREVVELLEADLKRAEKRMAATGSQTRDRAAEAVAIIDDLRRDTENLAEQTGTAKRNIEALAEGFHELNQTAEEIGRRAETSQRLVDDAVGVAKVASDSVTELKLAIEQIQAVVSLIADVAGQTNLLALNATIEAARAADLGREVEAATRTMNGSVADMTRQLVTVLRQTPEADRRRHDRWPVGLRGDLRIGSAQVPFHTIDLSLGGALVVPDREAGIPDGARIELDIVGLCRVAATVVGHSTHGLHVRFAEDDQAAETKIRAKIAELDADYRPMIHRAQRAAERIVGVIEQAVASGDLSTSALFDTDYRPIEGSAPIQFETRALAALERILPPVQEEILVEDTRMSFCAVVDINGWLPVHNKIYSQPQRRGDLAWNTANSRNRRIYDDRTGLLAARNTRPFLVQSYMRDLGAGNIVAMKEVDIPLMITGRHWGGFRTAYKM